ncbi:MAG: hypothetical protein ACJA08_001128 [Cyclobacteriaceae bacterium]|jgi:hypothetical protein
MIRISSLLLIAFLCTKQFAFSQSDFREGFVILQSGDTIKGLLDYKGNLANAKKCIFRESIESQNQVYTPDNLRAYRFTDGKYYLSKSLPSPDSNTLLFLEYLINGVVDVYYYRNDIGEHYLIEDEEGNLIELRDTQRDRIVNGKSYQYSSKEYVGILKVVFNKSMGIMNKVDQIELRHKSLIKITNEYHDAVCDDVACIIYEKKMPKINKSFGLVLGASTINFKVTREYPSQQKFDIEQFDYYTNMSIGLFYKQNMPFINERMNILYELTYSKMRLQKQWTEEAFLVSINQDEALINHSMNNNISVVYEFPKGKIQPIILAGLFFNYFISSYRWNFESVSNSDGVILGKDSSNKSPFLKNDLGYSLGLGLKSDSFLNREIYLALKYQHGQGFRDFLVTNTFNLNFGVEF